MYDVDQVTVMGLATSSARMTKPCPWSGEPPCSLAVYSKLTGGQRQMVRPYLKWLNAAGAFEDTRAWEYN